MFNGQAYKLGLPVNSTLDWKAMRFAYEFDFVVKNRGFVGFIAEAKYTDVRVSLTEPDHGCQRAVASPGANSAIGGIARVSCRAQYLDYR